MSLGLKHIVIAVSVFWLAYCQLEPEERECPAFWVTNGNFCYFIHPNSSGGVESDLASWSDARSICRAQHSSRLLYYDSEPERIFINEQIDPPFNNGYLWIGLRQHKATGPYIWENGVTLSEEDTHWEAGQPDKREGDEMCIDVLTGDTKATGIWRDRPCEEMKGFICKYELGVEVIFPEEPSIVSSSLPVTSSLFLAPSTQYTTVFEVYSSAPEVNTTFIITETDYEVASFQFFTSTLYSDISSFDFTIELSSTNNIPEVQTSYFASMPIAESSSLITPFISSSHVILTPSTPAEPTSSITSSSSLPEITSSILSSSPNLLIEAMITSSESFTFSSSVATASTASSFNVYSSFSITTKTPSLSIHWPQETSSPTNSPSQSIHVGNDTSVNATETFTDWCAQDVLNGVTWYPTLAGVVVSMACPNSTDYRYVTRSCIAVESTGIWINSNFTSCEQSEKPPTVQVQWLLVITYICASITIFLLLVSVLILISLRFLETSTMVVRCCLALSMIATAIFFIITFETEKHNTICRLAVVGFQYWVNAQFLWILLESMRLYIEATSRKNAVRTSVYNFTGWVLPLVLVLICAVLYFEEFDELIRCFRKWHIFLCFLVPVAVLIIVVLLFLTFFQTKQVVLLNRNSQSADRPKAKGSFRKELRGTCVLFAMLSSCWMTALVAVRFDSRTLQLIFAILLLLEGIAFVLIYIVFNEAVRDALQPQPAQPTVVEMKCEWRNNRLGSDHFLPFNTSSTHRDGPTASMGRRFSRSDTFRSAILSSHNRFGLNLRRNSVGSSTVCTGDSSNTSTGVTTCDDSSSVWPRYGGSVRSRPGGGVYTGSNAAESLRGGSQSGNRRSSKIHRRKHKARNTVLEHKILQHVRVEETSSRRKRASRHSKKRCPIPSDTSSSSVTNSSTHSLRILSTSLKSKSNPFNAAKVSPSLDESTVDASDAFKTPATRRLSWSKTLDNTHSQPITRISLRGDNGVPQCERISMNPPVQPKLKSCAGRRTSIDVNSTSPSRPTNDGILKHKQPTTDSTIRISMLTPLETSFTN